MDIALDSFFNIFRVILEMAESSVLSGSAGHVTYMTTLILTKRIHNFCDSLIEMEGPPCSSSYHQLHKFSSMPHETQGGRGKMLNDE